MSEGSQAAHIRTLIVDDEALSRRGLVIRLARAPEFQIVAQATNGREALAAIREHFAQRNAMTHRDRLVGLIAEITGGGESALADVIAGAGGAHAGKHLEMLPIRQGRETVRVEASAIDWIDAAGDYMCVHSEGQTYVLRGTMKDLESALDPRLFQRVHRSTIVNLRRVKRLRAHMNGEYFLTLEGGHELKLSRSYRDKVEYFLKGARLN